MMFDQELRPQQHPPRTTTCGRRRRVAAWDAGARLRAQIDSSPAKTWKGVAALLDTFREGQPAIVTKFVAAIGRKNFLDDPVLILVNARIGIWKECNRYSDATLGEEAFDTLTDQVDVFSEALDELIARAVAISPEGVIAQVRLLTAGEPVDGRLVNLLVASIATGIRALTRRAGIQP